MFLKINKMSKLKKKKIILTGITASPGNAFGKVRIVKVPGDILKTKKEEIIVAPFLTPEFVLLLRKNRQIKGIVTDRGGSTSHIAILAREFGIPYIAGTGTATKKLKNNTAVNLDGKLGTVYEV